MCSMWLPLPTTGMEVKEKLMSACNVEDERVNLTEGGHQLLQHCEQPAPVAYFPGEKSE